VCTFDSKLTAPTTRPVAHAGRRGAKRSAAIPAKMKIGISGRVSPAESSAAVRIRRAARSGHRTLKPRVFSVADQGRGLKRAARASAKAGNPVGRVPKGRESLNVELELGGQDSTPGEQDGSEKKRYG